MNTAFPWILKIVAVVAMLGGAAAIATPKGRLPLALRGLKRVLRRDRGESAVDPSDAGSLVPVWKRLVAFLLVIGAALVASAASAAVPKVIFDTDMCSDYDDAGALACLHALADAGECEILATVSCTRGSHAVAMCEIINAFYGRPDIPVGCVKGIGVGKDEPPAPNDPIYGAVVKKYAGWVRHLDSNDAPDATDVYRRVLAAQPDKSVVICSVGFLSNLRKLVEADRDLVARKVRLWVAMACAYPRGCECNSMSDAQSSRIALERWPTRAVFSDFQYGRDCFAGRAAAESKTASGPVVEVFRACIPDRREILKDAARQFSGCNALEGRAAWDETAVLAAVRGTDRYFNVRRGRFRMTGAGGENEWIPDEANGPHVRITEKTGKLEVGRIIDELICRAPRHPGILPGAGDAVK